MAQPCVSNHEASSFETQSCGSLLRMRSGTGAATTAPPWPDLFRPSTPSRHF